MKGAIAAGFGFVRLFAVLGVGFAVTLLCVVVSTAFGEQPLRWSTVTTPGSTDAVIFYSLRLPRVLLAAIVGAALASSGSVLQALLRNPLADPFVLGVSGGAALGATVAMAFNMTWMLGTAGLTTTMACALAGAAGATAIVMLIGRFAGGSLSHATLLSGVIFNAFALAAITLIKSLVAPDRLGEIFFWLAGMLRHETTETLLVVGALVLIALGIMIALSPRLNLLSLGDEDAQSLGVNVKRTRNVLLIATSLAVAAVVSVSGLIGFVGLLVPHAVRLAIGADQRLAVPASALMGASFLMLADLGTRLLFSVFNTEPPVGVITALLGGPVFLLLLLRAERRSIA